MIDKMIDKLLNRQILLGTMEVSDISVYRYGYTLMLETITNIIIAIIVAEITGEWFYILLFLLMFIPLRSFTGGWHSKRFEICAVWSNFVIIFGIIISETAMKTGEYGFIALEIISFVIIILLAPVQSKSKRLSDNEIKKYKKSATAVFIVEACLGIIFWGFIGIDGGWPVIYAHLSAAVSVAIGYLLKN